MNWSPAKQDVRTELAQAYVNTGRFWEAEREARHATEQAPTGFNLGVLGRTLIYERKPEQAIPYLAQAAELNRESINSVYLAVAYRHASRGAEAVAANERARMLLREELSQDYRDGVARARLAYVSAQLGDRVTAQLEVLQALRASGAENDARFMAALTYETLNQREEALALAEDSPVEVIQDWTRWPDLADLTRDPRFIAMMAKRRK